MDSKPNRLVFEDAEKARDSITTSQNKKISKLYSDWAKDIGKRAKYYESKSAPSYVLKKRQAEALQDALKEQSRQISNEIYNGIKQSIYLVSDAVVRDNIRWLERFGFSNQALSAAFTSIPDRTVRTLITGKLYKGGWNLSKQIWGYNEKIMSNCYEIVAKGLAENKPLYNIAKELERYVSPNEKKAWNPLLKTLNTKTGQWEYKRIYRGKVDYNAQRLARTLIQHGYQQSFIAVTKDNPFVVQYQWLANGSRACQICKDRDGQKYSKDNLPMDHPNGMCTMVPVIEDDITGRLADWFNSPDGTYPDIDKFAKKLGYNPENN